MTEHIFELLRNFLNQYGYGAVAIILLLENMGLPVPGETVLLLASALAYSHTDLQLSYVIIIAICAATIGDNLGFALGRYGGRRLLDRYRSFFRISEATITRGESLFLRYGSLTIFFARFIAGLRIVAGPLAGVLHMDWKKFLLFNFLGASLWVVVISTVGYLSGKHISKLAHLLKTMDFISIAGLAILIVIGIAWYWKTRRKFQR